MFCLASLNVTWETCGLVHDGELKQGTRSRDNARGHNECQGYTPKQSPCCMSNVHYSIPILFTQARR